MSIEQPKFPLGTEVNVDFIGKIVSIGYNLAGKLEYKITDGKDNTAYVTKDSYLYPLPEPGDQK